MTNNRILHTNEFANVNITTSNSIPTTTRLIPKNGMIGKDFVYVIEIYFDGA